MDNNGPTDSEIDDQAIEDEIERQEQAAREEQDEDNGPSDEDIENEEIEKDIERQEEIARGEL